jgi:hypothetical protein
VSAIVNCYTIYFKKGGSKLMGNKQKYKPYIAVEMVKKQSKWDKKVYEIAKEKGWNKFYEKLIQLMDYTYNSEESLLFGVRIAKIMIKRAKKNKKYYSLINLIQDDFNKTVEIYDFINYVCLKYDINFFRFIESFVKIEFLSLIKDKFLLRQYMLQNDPKYSDDNFILIRHLIKYKDLKNPKYEIIYLPLYSKDVPISIEISIEIVYNNFFKIPQEYEKFFKNPLNYPSKQILYFFKNTINKSKNSINSLKLKYQSEEIKIDKDINNDFNLINNISISIKKERIFNYALNNEAHHLNILFNDELTVDITDNELKGYFKNFHKGLTYGIYEKGIYFGSYKYKQVLINKLKRGKEFLKDFSKELKTEQIEIIDELINFLSQDKRIANYITFKELSKHTKATKNQIKNLIKTLLSKDKGDKYKDNFSKVVTLNNAIKK